MQANAQAQGAPQMSARDLNNLARSAILTNAVDMWNQIAQASLASGIVGTQVNVPIRNVGLIKRFLLKITGSFAQGAAETQTLTKLGLANVISNFTFTDLSNQQRINTAGAQLHYLASARRQAVFGAAFTNDTPTGMGSNFTIIKAPSSVTTIQTWSMYYELPISYGDYDLRGGIFANVVNATMQLQFTFNPNFSVASTADPTLAVYQSSTAQQGVVSLVTWTLYQNYLDQLPVDPKTGRTVLPLQDLSTAYVLNSTAAAAVVASQDNPYPYANFRNFMSTFAVYDNNGTLNTGSDINYFAIQAANYTNLIKIDPQTAVLIYQREILGDDFPAGMYYFDHRRKPISTIQYGNMQLIINPSSAPAGTQVLLWYEQIALIDQITQAGSLYGT